MHPPSPAFACSHAPRIHLIARAALSGRAPQTHVHLLVYLGQTSPCLLRARPRERWTDACLPTAEYVRSCKFLQHGPQRLECGESDKRRGARLDIAGRGVGRSAYGGRGAFTRGGGTNAVDLGGSPDGGILEGRDQALQGRTLLEQWVALGYCTRHPVRPLRPHAPPHPLDVAFRLSGRASPYAGSPPVGKMDRCSPPDRSQYFSMHRSSTRTSALGIWQASRKQGCARLRSRA